ncbi:helix-turn-helix transcriptional regulator [Actinoplanes sp. N902-109]|uniref:helix-turn-helix transcriptional regulator n=1 Tax=Actinoplanes sp. (strain N902-109) TaxID=649831 RepID=UPI0003296657|nr:helix-turn-helix transcriptional regulator [Actinoplanes sp. N902-109]AGL20101.1 LuxR family transcriptional regulator [Actinoplanes sp. N902-109]
MLEIDAALGRIRRATGLPVAFGGAVSADGRAMRLTEFAGTVTPALNGLVVSAGNGLGGRVVSTSRPARVEDYTADPRISHEYDKPVNAEGLRAIAAVPVTVAGAVVGVLYAGTREPLAVGARGIDAMGRVAGRVATELTVRREVQRRLAEVATAAARARTDHTAPEWEDVRQAHADLRTIAQEVTDAALRTRLQRVCALLSGSGGPAAPVVALSAREIDVLTMVAVGCSNAEAAGRLGLQPETVKSYLRNATRKLGTHGRIETVAAARRHGFLP